jgi:hypothetical protein
LSFIACPFLEENSLPRVCGRIHRAVLKEIAGKKNISASVLRFGYSAFRYVDHAICFPLWLSVYNDALLKNGPEMRRRVAGGDA